MEKICEVNGISINGTISSELKKSSIPEIKSSLSKRQLEKKVNKLYYKGGISIDAYCDLIKICE